MDINYLSDGDQSIHTPNALNEVLDEISTDSSVSSLSWDPRFQVDADTVNQNIRDIAGSLSNYYHHNGDNMNDQMTQTSDHSMSYVSDLNDSIIDINLKTDISPIELYPSFTAGIQLESSDYDEDLTHPKYIQENKENEISNFTVSNDESNNNVNVSSSGTQISSEDLIGGIVNEHSCTRSGLIYK